MLVRMDESRELMATPQNPHFEALQIQQKEYFLLSYIAEAPKTASIAVLKASLGEDKYAGMNS